MASPFKALESDATLTLTNKNIMHNFIHTFARIFQSTFVSTFSRSQSRAFMFVRLRALFKSSVLIETETQICEGTATFNSI
ncbi:hypothetical protein H5410_040460 [Solanum commersonii]|uniref:Uncharacterized protein n=1 Tax=Solanum commersonii TaxID=4109 RepID=A0A9J5XQ79_SOLCO|nr:hypothetical protein H5410_040460 [Solanum commersonii]